MQDSKTDCGVPARGTLPALAERLVPCAYALMRVVFGFLFLCRGLQKMFGLFAGRIANLASPRWFAALIELVAGALIMIGLQPRPTAFVASGEMGVAYFLFQQPAGLLPIQNGGEAAVLYCFAFLFIAARGAGVYSIDGARARP
jgi:putative oxidoreductase